MARGLRISFPFGLPAWRQGMEIGEWREIDGTAMSDFPPSVAGGGVVGASSKVIAWCGGSIDTRTSTIWRLAEGGHDDYHGNEVDKFSGEEDEPEWVEMLAGDASDRTSDSSGYYPSGRPTSSHTYYSEQFIESLDRAMRFGVGSRSPGGEPSTAVDGFDCTVAQGVNGWDAQDTYPDLILAQTNIVSCKDPSTEEVYLVPGDEPTNHGQCWLPSD
jgi:hypothetical protein